jgi:hypothetical protein
MRARFDRSYIRSELERIGQQLDDPLTVFLIGGGAMAFVISRPPPRISISWRVR